jgi:hypothetical protein
MTSPDRSYTSTLTANGWTAPEAVPVPVADAACDPPADSIRLDTGAYVHIGSDDRTAATTLTLRATARRPAETDRAAQDAGIRDPSGRGTNDAGHKIDYIYATFTTGALSAVTDTIWSDHHYYMAVFAFTR